jgi:hypothetical protein
MTVLLRLTKNLFFAGLLLLGTNSYVLSCSLDIDNDGNLDALTDGLLLMRHLFNVTGDALTENTVSANAQRSNADDISAYLASSECQQFFDIDGDQQTDALTDGVITMRYLFGLSGSALIQGAISDNAVRTTVTDITDFLDTKKASSESTPTTPNVEELSNPAVVYQRINELPGITSFTTVAWLIGEWSSAFESNGVMIDEKFIFNADGSFSEKRYKYENGQELGFSGQWDVFTVENSDWHYLVLKSNDGSITYYPIERDGEEAVRIVLPQNSQTYMNAQLLVRLKPESNTSIYPGRSILGVYGWKNSEFVYRLILEASNQATFNTYVNSELVEQVKGTWTLTPSDLILNLASEIKYDIEMFDHRSLTFKSPDNTEISMVKFDDAVADYGTDFFVGEFQNGGGPVDGVDRVSIVGLGNNQYRVDIHVVSVNHKNLSAIQKQDGLLYVDVPGTNEKVVFKPVFNGIKVVKSLGFDNFMRGYSPDINFLSGESDGQPGEKYFEKISNKPLSQITDSIGWWRGDRKSVRLFDDIHYFIQDKQVGFLDYGTYSVQQGNFIMKSICGEPEARTFPIDNNQLVFQTALNPVPGMNELGRTGWNLRYLLKRYEDDASKNVKAPLAPHPTISDAFVVKQATEWSAGAATGSSAFTTTLSLKPNGSGNKSIASIQQNLVLVSEINLPNPEWHTKLESYVQGIEYHIEARGDKEYIVFKETGAYAALVDGVLHEGTFNENNPQRESLLFDGRANVCYKLTPSSDEKTLGKR